MTNECENCGTPFENDESFDGADRYCSIACSEVELEAEKFYKEFHLDIDTNESLNTVQKDLIRQYWCEKFGMTRMAQKVSKG